MNQTIIYSNGSKWAGQQPDGLDKLKERLKNNKLNVRDFAKYGFVNWDDNGDIVRLFGNFSDVSAVFNIEGDSNSPELKEIIDLIDTNIKNQFDNPLI